MSGEDEWHVDSHNNSTYAAGHIGEAAGWNLDGEEKVQFLALLNRRIYSSAGPQRPLLIRLNKVELEHQGKTSLMFDLEVMLCQGSDDLAGSLLYCFCSTSRNEQLIELYHGAAAVIPRSQACRQQQDAQAL